MELGTPRKAGNDAALAREPLDHLERYIRLLFNTEGAANAQAH
ncbi:MAG: hypothetical protein ACTHLT_07565 [Devosia sp.]